MVLSGRIFLRGGLHLGVWYGKIQIGVGNAHAKKQKDGQVMPKRTVTLERPERFAGKRIIDRDKLERAARAACDKLKARVMREGKGFPATASTDFKYDQGTNSHWECGMYSACFQLAYQLTGDEFFKEVALEHLETYRERWENKVGLDDHDVGFVYMPGCVSSYKLYGNEAAKKIALEVVDYYYDTSWSPEGRFIIRLHKSWRAGYADGYRTMMDSLMNAPFFFWASEVTGDPKYREAAIEHVRTTDNLLIREDGSSFHHYQFDPVTHAPVRGLTWQGHSDDSCWSRGHSWGVYGFPIAYSYAHEQFMKDVHRDVTYFMLNHLPEDFIPYWDYDFVEGDQPRDSSAGVISACGLIEMAGMMQDDEPDKAIFENAAAAMLEAVIDNCTGDIGRDYDGLICHVTHALPQGHGIDECAIYGDYFYLEALARYLVPGFKKYW